MSEASSDMPDVKADGPTDAFHLDCPSCGQAIDLIPAAKFYSDEEARRQIGNLEAAGVDWMARAQAAQERAERLEEGLRRLGSMEAFVTSRTIKPGQDDELIARIDYARALLSPQGGEG